MDTKKEPDEMMKVAAAAKYLCVSKALIYQMIIRKKIPHIRLSERRVVIKKADLDQWLLARTCKC